MMEPIDPIKETPNFFKVISGEYDLLTGYKEAHLTDVEKIVIMEQLDKWFEKTGKKMNELSKADQESIIKIFFTGYLCGMLFGAVGVRRLHHLERYKN